MFPKPVYFLSDKISANLAFSLSCRQRGGGARFCSASKHLLRKSPEDERVPKALPLGNLEWSCHFRATRYHHAKGSRRRA